MGKNVTSLSATFDSRKAAQAYEVQLFKRVDLSVGDEVRIVYHPLSIRVDTRIVGLTYNPFDRYTVRVEVGDYVPNLLARKRSVWKESGRNSGPPTGGWSPSSNQ